MRHTLATSFFLGTAILALSACVAKPTYLIDDAPPLRGSVSDTTIALIDQRPASDRESSLGSLLISSEHYGIFTLGDERFVPPPLSALSQRVLRASNTWPARPQTITLTVKRFSTQNNAQAAMRNSAIGISGLGPLGIAIGEAILGKMREQNVDARKPFILCYIEADAELRWGNNRRETRTISVIKAQNYDENDIEDQKIKIAQTVAKALETAVATLGK